MAKAKYLGIYEYSNPMTFTKRYEAYGMISKKKASEWGNYLNFQSRPLMEVSFYDFGPFKKMYDKYKRSPGFIIN